MIKITIRDPESGTDSRKGRYYPLEGGGLFYFSGGNIIWGGNKDRGNLPHLY